MQAHSTRTRLPLRAGLVIPQAGQFLPVLPAVDGAEQRCVLYAGVNRIGVVQRRFEVPDPGELPRVWRAVVPLVRARDSVIAELIADCLPALAAVVGALDLLAEPARGLRQIQPVGVGRGTLGVVDLPASEVRAAHVPHISCAVGRQHEGAFARADQYSHSGHQQLQVSVRKRRPSAKLEQADYPAETRRSDTPSSTMPPD